MKRKFCLRTGVCLTAMGICLAGMLLLGGCAEKAPENLLAEDVQTETLYLRADGTVQSAYVEEFDKSYYDIEELSSFMEEQITAYNQNTGKDAVDLTNVQMAEGKVYAVLTYQDLSVYADFNMDVRAGETEMPAESVSAEQAKERFGEEAFYQAKSLKEMKTGSEVLNAKKQKVVVVSGPIQIRTYGNILYYTGGTLADKRTLEIPENVRAVIIYKK